MLASLYRSQRLATETVLTHGMIVAEDSITRGNDDIATKRELKSARHRSTLNTRDGRNEGFLNSVEWIDLTNHVFFEFGIVSNCVDVDPSAERLAGGH